MTAEAEVLSQPVLLDRLEAGVLTLTLNRPERLNALNAALIEALSAGIKRAGGGGRMPRGSDHRRRPRLLRRGGPREPRVCSRRSPARPRRSARKRPQPADPRDPQPAEAGRLRSQRPGGRGGRQYRACLRHRAGGEIGPVSAGVRPHRPHSGRGRHFCAAAAHWRRARSGADDAGRADRRRAGPGRGHDLSRR